MDPFEEAAAPRNGGTNGPMSGLLMTTADTTWHPSRAIETASERSRGRIQALDVARGFAVCLMILSHGVNGLLRFDQFTWWGRVPIHAITKFSSSLFFLVFGVTLAVAFLPKTQGPDWPSRRRRLIRRGLVVLFWYKVLTVVEMQHLHEPDEILAAIAYQRFPSYVEILGYYAIALLWIPFLLPVWGHLPSWARWSSPAAMTAGAWLVATQVPFGEAEWVQALLVEHPDHYTWGQLTRAPLVLLGLCIGGALRRRGTPASRQRVTRALLAAGLLLLSGFFLTSAADPWGSLEAVARNVGKHPPELSFMMFSLGGALLLLALALQGGETMATLLRPVTRVGSDALQAFIFHIAVIFLVLRTGLGYFHTVSYELALVLAIGLIFATSAWIAAYGWVRALLHRRFRAS